MDATSKSFLENIVDQMGNLLGDKAGSAAFQFAAQSEGARLAEGTPDLQRILRRVDGMMGHKSELLSEEPVAIVVRESSLMDGSPVRESLVLGVLEGAISERAGRRCKASVRERGDDSVTVEVTHA